MRNDRQFLMLTMSLVALLAAIAFFAYQSRNSSRLTEKEFLLNDLARQNGELEKSYNDKIYVLDNSLQETSRNLNSKLYELKEINQDNSRLKTTTLVQQSKIDELSKNTEKLAQEKAELEKRIQALETQKAAAISSGMPVTIVSTTKASGSIGQILQVNKDYQFVVISAGTNKGVQKGDTLSVIRSGVLIGKITAERISDKSSAAGIPSEYISADFQVGDQVFD